MPNLILSVVKVRVQCSESQIRDIDPIKVQLGPLMSEIRDIGDPIKVHWDHR